MLPGRTATRSAVRNALARLLRSPQRARACYDLLSALRNLVILSWSRRLHPAFWRGRSADRRAGRVSVAIHGEFGDAVLALPYLVALKQRLGGQRLRVLVRGEAAGTATSSARDAG